VLCKREWSAAVCLTASALLGIGVRRLANFENLALATEDVLTAFALIKGFAGYDAIDLCGSC
jgi:hypothetical protein